MTEEEKFVILKTMDCRTSSFSRRFMKIMPRMLIILTCGLTLISSVPGVCTSQTAFPVPMLFAKTERSVHQAPPALTVKNIRYHDHQTHTRVVLVMNGSVAINESKGRTKTMISLANSKLSLHAQQQIKKKTFPHAMAIAQEKEKTVTITLNRDTLRTYKLLTLRRPDRVVVDLFYPTLRVVIDPGHGGKDPGAIGQGGTQEKAIVLQIAKTLRALIQERLKAKVFLTRTTDVFLDLTKRVDFAKEKKADLFISIHANSHAQRSIQGMEIYYFGKASDPRALKVAARENGMPLKKNDPPWRYFLAENVNKKKIEKSLNFAFTTNETLVKTVRKDYTIKEHGVKTAPFYVLLSTSMPGILAEVGFISNPMEEKRLRNAAFQKKLAEGIYQGIQRCTHSSNAPCLYARESNDGQ